MNFQFSLARLLAALTCLALAFAASRLPVWEWATSDRSQISVPLGTILAPLLGSVAWSLLFYAPRDIAAMAVLTVGAATSLGVLIAIGYGHSQLAGVPAPPYHLLVGSVLMCLSGIATVTIRSPRESRSARLLGFWVFIVFLQASFLGLLWLALVTLSDRMYL